MSPSYDLGLIVPLGEEFAAFREMVPIEDSLNIAGHHFYEFAIPGTPRRGVATVLFDMGPATAAVAAANLLARFSPHLLAVVGIAGALDTDLRLGDVVVASEIIDYMHAAKATPDASGTGFEFKATGTSWKPAFEILSFVDNFRFLPRSEARFDEWQESTVERLPALPGRDDPGPAKYVVGPIASGDVVGVAQSFTAWLLTRNRKFQAIEMEAAGASLSQYRHGSTNLLVVRGISDHADHQKSARSGWRRYATHNAVALLMAMTSAPDFPWPASAADPTPPNGTGPRGSLLSTPPEVSPSTGERIWDGHPVVPVQGSQTRAPGDGRDADPSNPWADIVESPRPWEIVEPPDDPWTPRGRAAGPLSP